MSLNYNLQFWRWCGQEGSHTQIVDPPFRNMNILTNQCQVWKDSQWLALFTSFYFLFENARIKCHFDIFCDHHRRWATRNPTHGVGLHPGTPCDVPWVPSFGAGPCKNTRSPVLLVGFLALNSLGFGMFYSQNLSWNGYSNIVVILYYL